MEKVSKNCCPSLLVCWEKNLFLSLGVYIPLSFAREAFFPSDPAMGRGNRIAAEDSSVPLFPMCMPLPKQCRGCC